MASPRTRSQQQYKRLVVLSDGTWQTPENRVPTNILKLTMALRHESDDFVQQVLFYDSGVGTAGALDAVRGGALGAGIDVNIQEIYTWLAVNYDDGDEVYMFGFSRGSYTVRSLAGLIHESGLVRRKEVQWVAEAYKLYRENEDPESEEAVAFRDAHGDRIPIKLLACFDTVGSLGLPSSVWGGNLDDGLYAFHSTCLAPEVQHALHAMSVDESRAVFAPTEMTANPEWTPVDAATGQLTQLYFPGGHGGVGGGDDWEWPLSDYALAWMVREIRRRGIDLAFDPDGIPEGSLAVGRKEPGKPTATGRLINLFSARHVRKIESVAQCHAAVALRYEAVSDWRPDALADIGDDLLRAAAELKDGSRDIDEPLLLA